MRIPRLACRTACLLALPLALVGGRVHAESAIEACQVCHVAEGINAPGVPYLDGQNEAFLYDMLKGFKAGRRRSPVMTPLLADQSDARLQVFARQFAERPYRRPAQAINAARVERGRAVYGRVCLICHLDSGRASVYVEQPLLAGQSLDYLLRQMETILAGERAVDITKRGMLALLGRDEIDDAIHYFAAQLAAPGQVAGGVNHPGRRSRKILPSP